MQSIKTLAREAYKNRYGFARVTIDTAGKILGHWDTPSKPPSVDLGHIADCRTSETDRRTGVRFYNRHFLVFIFSMDAAK